MSLDFEFSGTPVGNQWVEIAFQAIWGMSALGRFLPFAIVSRDRPLLGESGHSEKRHRSTHA